MQKKNVPSDSAYHCTSLVKDQYPDYDFRQIRQARGNFLAADWLLRSLPGR